MCAAWFDYDNDGLLDLVVSNYTFWSPQTDIHCTFEGHGEIYCSPTRYQSVPHTLYRNLGDGQVRGRDASTRGSPPRATARAWASPIADFNDDGWMDVFIANDTEPNFLFMNQGDGTFEEAAAWNMA